MAEYLIKTRDWKGSYCNIPKGWKTLAGEDEIETLGDCLAMIFFKGKPMHKKTPQEIYDIWRRLDDDDVEGYYKKFSGDEIMWETKWE